MHCVAPIGDKVNKIISKLADPASANLNRDEPQVYITNAEDEKLDHVVDEILSLVKNQHEY